jgi:hypothetical protein
MNDNLYRQIFNNLNLKETEELVDIWITNDRFEWSDLAFEAVKAILAERLETVPPQNEPLFEHKVTKEKGTGLLQNEQDAFPRLYDPMEVIRLNRMINLSASAVVAASILTGMLNLPNLQQIFLSFFINNNQTALLFSWVSAAMLSIITITLECFISYFAIKSLASILAILMEMEFNSRNTEMNYQSLVPDLVEE